MENINTIKERLVAEYRKWLASKMTATGLHIPRSALEVDEWLRTALDTLEASVREEIRPFVERVRLDVDVIKCDCGEPYKDSDLDLSVGELENALTPP